MAIALTLTANTTFIYVTAVSVSGIAAAQTKNESDWEEKFRTIPQLEKIKEYMRALSSEPLLKSLGGQVVPESWRGALPITYHIGPGPATVRLKVISDWNIRTLYNVVARIRGAAYPDEWIIRGNHHDAWVNGASDPASGMAVVLEEARAFGELLKQGWRPNRTIIFCAWDGEEPGLLGSTEWAERHAEELKQGERPDIAVRVHQLCRNGRW